MMKKIPETHLKYDPETGNIFNGTTIIGSLLDPDDTFVCRNEITADDVTVGDIRAMIPGYAPPQGAEPEEDNERNYCCGCGIPLTAEQLSEGYEMCEECYEI